MGRGGGPTRPRARAQGAPVGHDLIFRTVAHCQEKAPSRAVIGTGTTAGPGTRPLRSLGAAKRECPGLSSAIVIPRELHASSQAAASFEEQAGQWAALEPLAAHGGALARVIVQTRLHGICPTPCLASRTDIDAVRAPFVAHGSLYLINFIYDLNKRA